MVVEMFMEGLGEVAGVLEFLSRKWEQEMNCCLYSYHVSGRGYFEEQPSVTAGRRDLS